MNRTCISQIERVCPQCVLQLTRRPWTSIAILILHRFGFHSNSTGISMPTRLAVKRTLSSSSMPAPGLYLSSSVPYILCAFRYWINCSSSCRRASPYSDDAFLSGVEKCERMELCSEESGEEREAKGRGGSSRSTRRYSERACAVASDAAIVPVDE